jgi:hypothetical protein
MPLKNKILLRKYQREWRRKKFNSKENKFGLGRGIKRYCKKGHDKTLPHGTYYAKNNKVMGCAVCKREAYNNYYRNNKIKWVQKSQIKNTEKEILRE